MNTLSERLLMPHKRGLVTSCKAYYLRNRLFFTFQSRTLPRKTGRWIRFMTFTIQVVITRCGVITTLIGMYTPCMPHCDDDESDDWPEQTSVG